MTNVGQTLAAGVDEVLLLSLGSDHVIGITLNPILRIQPWENLGEELSSIALSDTELGDPNGLVEGFVEVDEIVLEIFGLVPGVVVSDNEVDITASALSHEFLEVVDAFARLVAVGDGRRTDAETLSSKGLDVLLVSSHGVTHGHVGATTTNLVRLIEREDVRDLVLLLGSGYVRGPALSAPLLVGVEQGNVFEIDGLAINDCLPVIHPGNLGGVGEGMGVLGASNTVVLLGESKTTLATTTGHERTGLCEHGKTSKGHENGRLEHVD